MHCVGVIAGYCPERLLITNAVEESVILEDIKEKEGLLVWGAISGEGLEQIREGQDLVIVPENRPSMTGLKYNIPLLRRHGIRFVYCTDNMVGLLFHRKKIRKTVIFYKQAVENGIIGVPGTLYAATLSHLHGVPVNAVPQPEIPFDSADQDASSLGGKSFVAEKYQKEVILPADERVENEILE